MIIGDVLAVTAAIGEVAAAWTATILLFMLAFPARTAAAATSLTAAPGACFGRGLAVVVACGLLALLCWHAPAGPVKLLIGLIAAGIGLASALVSAEAVRLPAERINTSATTLPPFGGVTRAAILYVLAGFLPLLAWPMPDGFPDTPAAWTGTLIPRRNFALALAGGTLENAALDTAALAEAGRKAGP